MMPPKTAMQNRNSASLKTAFRLRARHARKNSAKLTAATMEKKPATSSMAGLLK